MNRKSSARRTRRGRRQTAYGALLGVDRGKKPVLKNRVPQEIEDAIVTLAIEAAVLGSEGRVRTVAFCPS